ncbi:hypothetical protein BLOT_015527 [Blomia tropicalis]|nr:hypothetical protein BLOT_015527 [Blomia tropicalis]
MAIVLTIQTVNDGHRHMEMRQHFNARHMDDGNNHFGEDECQQPKEPFIYNCSFRRFHWLRPVSNWKLDEPPPPPYDNKHFKCSKSIDPPLN